MESMQEMGERTTSSLQSELHRSEVHLSNWIAEREQRLEDLQASFERSMEARANEVIELRKLGQDAGTKRRQYAAVAKRQEEQLQEEMRRLEELRVREREELPAKLEVLAAEHKRAAKSLEAKKDEMANRRYLKDEELSALGRGVLLYRRLGLEFEGGEVGDDGSMKCLRLVFRQISLTDHERPFVIAVSIDDRGRYVVPECFPSIPSERLEQMIDNVNRTNDFASFVSRARREFVALAESGL